MEISQPDAQEISLCPSRPDAGPAGEQEVVLYTDREIALQALASADGTSLRIAPV